MKEVMERELLHDYLQTYQLGLIFQEPLISHLSLYSFETGELICSQGEISEYLYVLVKGKIKVYNTSTEGKTLIISFKTPLEVIGEIEYLRNIEFINTVQAVTPVYMIAVHHRWLNQYGKDHAPLLQFLLDIITEKFCQKSNSFSLNLMYPVEVRLASYLLAISSDGSFALSVVDTANQIGTSYRHLNRVLQRFSTEGLIERKKGGLLIKDREGLSQIASHNIYE
ncbi:Crp/Fnr family transcriptional regulator [Ammoniphilus sp. CFH 90114]|uniref:Crp/Fnr family transcriptional regulator n=1 Tax=Ammoniphilus sp. CFH 90114 TaxID=2493665 RepID=UPI00100E8A43|nr:cyclic nucleotide-binding domain-containing protein [Ammoniphilus sp. CFH 90114]RXT07202.1 cyclic nucleotide-binding domain-containing protein [Ammoniphilus sp. CFH 90114]